MKRKKHTKKNRLSKIISFRISKMEYDKIQIHLIKNNNVSESLRDLMNSILKLKTGISKK